LRALLFSIALLLPVLAGLGFLTMGRDLASHPDPAVPIGDPAETAALGRASSHTLYAYLAVIGLVLVARAIRAAIEHRRKSVVRISYPDRSITVPRGWTVLEASRSFGIPHQSTCGGRARCTTCRVRVLAGETFCPPPETDERRTLHRIGAGPAVRLACQLRPAGDISVLPLIAVDRSRWLAPPQGLPTIDREVAVLFLEVRFEARDIIPAQDAVYALGRFQALFANSIGASGGIQCCHTGTSWTALFGTGTDELRAACLQAMDAAWRIEKQSAAFVGRLASELGLHAEFSLGIHAGPVVAAPIGEGASRALSAFGHALGAAELLQHAARTRIERFVISKAAFAAAGLNDAGVDWQVLEDGPAYANGPALRSALRATGAVSPH
jgi:adenylate cyclase